MDLTDSDSEIEVTSEVSEDSNQDDNRFEPDAPPLRFEQLNNLWYPIWEFLDYGLGNLFVEPAQQQQQVILQPPLIQPIPSLPLEVDEDDNMTSSKFYGYPSKSIIT